VTPQEQQLLSSLTERINNTQLQEKDPDAEALLNQELGRNPDAVYILAQTVLVQNIALEQARAQVTQSQVQQARQQPARATSFLGSLLGHHDPAPPPPPAPPAYVPPPPPPPQYVQAQYQQPQYGQPQYIPIGQPSFLRGAMQTAAGVAAGALAFEGVEAVLHGLGGFGNPGYGWGGPGFGMGGMGMGAGMMGGGFGRPVEETVINNYYDQPGSGHEHEQQGGFDQGGIGQSGDIPHFHESADQAGAQVTDASYNTADTSQGSYDAGDTTDSSLDTGQDVGQDLGSVDDGSGFDNSGFGDGGGGFDDGGGFGGDSGGGDLL
jgi:hypothetical protein